MSFPAMNQYCIQCDTKNIYNTCELNHTSCDHVIYYIGISFNINNLLFTFQASVSDS